MAMKSLMRPGMGRHSLWITPSARVAVLHRVGDDAKRHQIVDLIDRDLLPLQLLEDGEGALQRGLRRAPECLRARSFSWTSAFVVCRNSLVGVALLFDLARSVRRRLGLEMLEREIFQLAADLCPCRAGARWAHRSRWSRARCARAARATRPRASACCECGRPASR